jgi:hypothetical protein
MQKLQFDSSGEIQINRPNKFRASRSGGYADVAFVFDGTNFTIHDVANKSYVQVPSPGTSDQLIGRIRDEYGLEAPAADLLSSDPYDALMDGVTDLKYIGVGVIDGHECDHLAFRGFDADWQLWIDKGSQPIPRKYVISTKGIAGAPQYTFRVREWTADAGPTASAFDFKPDADVKKIDLQKMVNIDEVPAGVQMGAAK